MWYRAKINRVFEDKVDLYYVDFGDSEWMPRSSVFEIRYMLLKRSHILEIIFVLVALVWLIVFNLFVVCLYCIYVLF
jgi:hypothetical protein